LIEAENNYFNFKSIRGGGLEHARRLQSLKDRMGFARNVRKQHFNNRPRTNLRRFFLVIFVVFLIGGGALAAVKFPIIFNSISQESEEVFGNDLPSVEGELRVEFLYTTKNFGS